MRQYPFVKEKNLNFLFSSPFPNHSILSYFKLKPNNTFKEKNHVNNLSRVALILYFSRCISLPLNDWNISWWYKTSFINISQMQGLQFITDPSDTPKAFSSWVCIIDGIDDYTFGQLKEYDRKMPVYICAQRKAWSLKK